MTSLHALAEKFRVIPGTSLSLNQFNCADTGHFIDKTQAAGQLEDDKKRMSELQDVFYADNRYALLLIFQAMDTAGKDGAIKHVMGGINPQGCQVTSFKHPSEEEADHDFLWRHYKAMPEKGRIGIFNRSHYENVLICRVHPELIVGQHIPGIRSVDDIGEPFWQERFRQIREFENTSVANGTVILKFFLHISREEQRERLLSRINDPSKHWKFSFSDIRERNYWENYMKAYEEAPVHTSTGQSPWYVIPSDKKWFSRMLIASIIVQTLEKLPLYYPKPDPEEMARLEEGKKLLHSDK